MTRTLFSDIKKLAVKLNHILYSNHGTNSQNKLGGGGVGCPLTPYTHVYSPFDPVYHRIGMLLTQSGYLTDKKTRILLVGGYKGVERVNHCCTLGRHFESENGAKKCFKKGA
jgi:hypothetical protein